MDFTLLQTIAVSKQRPLDMSGLRLNGISTTTLSVLLPYEQRVRATAFLSRFGSRAPGSPAMTWTSHQLRP